MAHAKKDSFSSGAAASTVSEALACPWEAPDCLLCGGRRRLTLVEALEGCAAAGWPRPAVVRCDQCGLCYTCPRPTPGAMAQFYSPQYSAHRVRPVTSPSQLGRWWRWATRSRSPERDGLPWHGSGRLLDFGCGAGAFLQQMRRRGWEVLGVDAAEPVVRRIRDELGLPALAGDLSLPELAAARFDVITMWQSLEHVHRPLEVLGQALGLLAPGGRLFVSVPNIDGLPFRWFGAAWYGLDLPRHLTHFSPTTLREMVARTGFRVDAVRMMPHSSWLQRSAQRAGRHGGATAWLRGLRFRPLCRLVARYCVLAGRSDCILLAATKPGVTTASSLPSPALRERVR